MPHQCIHCSKLYPDASEELLKGCSCGSHFFFYIKEDQLKKIQEKEIVLELREEDKEKIEHDVREIMGLENEETPVILDLESIRVLGPGKFEIDIVNLFNKKRPLIYKLEEGKYIIDLAASFKSAIEESERKMSKD
ncbi:MAG: Zn-ribbon containing protein [Candidatus Pacearchaeota archaeon]